MDWLYNFLFLMQGDPAGAQSAAGAAPAGAEQATDAAQKVGCGTGMAGLDMVLMMVVFFGLMYFMLLRPEKKRRTAHQKMLESLKKGDRVVTNGGLLGTVRGLTTTTLSLEVGDDVVVKVQRTAIAGLQVEPKGEDEGKTGNK